ncbi:MAG TPA: hypothetical protein VLA89_05955, partial [Gemmatimonadales bacterium]|nr:hypothetical protein [Gemmatimonadales bacterium]
MTRPERTRLIFPLFAIASLLASVAVACDEDQTAVTSAPADPEAFLERLEQVLTRNGKVYHVRMVATSVSEGTEQVSYRNEAWLYLANGEGRIEARRDPAWEIDRPLHELELTQKGSVYRWSEDIPTDPVTALTEAEAQVCISADVPRLVRIVPCALIAFSYSNLTLGVDADASFRSRETYALTMSVRYEPTRDLPPGGPTPGPAYTSVSRFHVDRESFLPVGVDSEGGDGYVTFEGDWIDRSTLPDDFFDPQALGYVPPGEEERRILEHPALGVPVHWLGRDADLGNGLPRLTLRGVDDRHPELPKLGDEPNVRLSLGYGSV